MSVEKWIAGAGVGLTWTDAFSTATLNSIVNGNAILSDLNITNGTALDIFADLSIALGSITAAAPNYIGIYLYPLNKDGTTYGDGRFGTSAAGPPPGNYWVGNIGFNTGAAAIVGNLTRIILPPGSFKFVFYNQAGATLVGSSGNTCQYRTYNRSIA
jgi:hypothetical protein